MIAQVARVETTVTRSEGEALLLENNLIKAEEPRYNILFRDDKSYPYVALTGEKFPQLRFHRGRLDRQHRYFGPFPSAGAVREGMALLQKVFQLRTCENTVFANRSRPCMLHQIARCSAPCVGLVSESDYREDVQSAVLFLQGKTGEVLAQLQAQMEEASAALALRACRAAARQDHPPHAAAVAPVRGKRDRRRHRRRRRRIGIGAGRRQRRHDPRRPARRRPLVFSAACRRRRARRGGRGVSRAALRRAAGAADDHRRPTAAITRRWPRCSRRRPASACRSPTIRAASGASGSTMARQNAVFAIKQKLARKATQEDRLAALQEALGLPPSAQRIECFDVSHTMGERAVASCVIFDGLAMQTGEYRRFNVAPTVGGDDYAAMREALTRRCARIVAGEFPAPDLLVIDGGKGQVAIACEVLAEQGLHDTRLIGIAKGPERKAGEEDIVFPDRAKVLNLPPDHPGLHLLQQIRDEAHRFAIQGHRARRAKARTTSSLQDIDGVGARKRQALLAHFGGLKGVQAASVDDLARVPGISRALAERIFADLH